MATNIVSFLETAKPPKVSELDLPSDHGCLIVQFMKHDREMGDLIRKLRTARQMTVDELAGILNMEKGTLSKKERGLISFDDPDLESAGSVFGKARWELVALASGVSQAKIDFANAYDVVSDGLRNDVIELANGRLGKDGTT